MLEDIISNIEEIIINIFKRLFKTLIKITLDVLKWTFKQLRIPLNTLHNKINKKISFIKDRFKCFFREYIVSKIDISIKHRKLISRMSLALLLVIFTTGIYFLGPKVSKHYKANNNSLSFIEYDTHKKVADTSNNSTSGNEEQPTPVNNNAPVVDESYRWPTEGNYYITTYFSRAHDGIDIAGCGYNSNIYAIYSGEVITSSYTSTNGNYVVIKDDKGVHSMYAHLANRYVSPGQHVEKGQVIGGMGATGFATGTHLHFSTWWGYPYYGGTPFNPYTLY